MTQSNDSQFQTLADDVRTALKQWHGDATAPSPLKYLYLYRHVLRDRQLQGFSGERGATNQLLSSAIERLMHTHDSDTQFLQYRFLDLWSIQRLSNHYNVAESTVYTMQTAAIGQLSETLRLMELDESAKHKNLLTTRLEPSSYVNLIGTDKIVEQLEGILLSDGPPWLISLEGIGGIGKTSLADFVMRRLIQQGCIDEVGWVTARQLRFNLGGAIHQTSEPALTGDMLVEKLAHQLMPELATSTNLSSEELLRRLQSRLQSIPHFIVVDNLETVIDIESLLPTLQALCNPSKFILTSRESLRIEPNVFPFDLHELNKHDALALIRQEAMLSNLPLLAECADAELAPLIDAVGGNPLALRLVAGQTHIHTLESIIQDLEMARGEPIQNLYTFIYRRAWENLDQLTRQVFLAMPLAQPGGETMEFLAKICELEIGQVRMALNKLVLLNLVDARGGLHERHYTIHGLTRTFLQEKVAKWE